MAWGKLGSTTLGATADIISIDPVSDVTNHTILVHMTSSGAADPSIRFNNDSGNNYARRVSSNGGSDTTNVSDSRYQMAAHTSRDSFTVHYAFNLTAEEKLCISFQLDQQATGAGTAPTRYEIVGKWANTSNAVIRTDLVNLNSGDFAADSNISALGSDLTPAAAIPFAENAQVGSRAEITDTRKIYHYNEPVIEYETTFSGSDSHTSDNTTVQGWLSSDASDIGVNGTGHYIDWDQSRGTNDSISYDLGTDVSSTKWILRYKIRWDAFVSNAYNEQRIGLSNLDSTNGHNASHDFIGAFHIYWTSVNRTFYGVDANGTAISADYPSSTYDSNGSESTNTWYYVSLQRLSATTFSVTYSSTDAYDGDLFQSSAYTCDATNVGHRYIYMTCENAGSGDAGMNSHISDIKFYNGVSSTDELGWKEEGT